MRAALSQFVLLFYIDQSFAVLVATATRSNNPDIFIKRGAFEVDILRQGMDI